MSATYFIWVPCLLCSCCLCGNTSACEPSGWFLHRLQVLRVWWLGVVLAQNWWIIPMSYFLVSILFVHISILISTFQPEICARFFAICRQKINLRTTTTTQARKGSMYIKKFQLQLTLVVWYASGIHGFLLDV